MSQQFLTSGMDRIHRTIPPAHYNHPQQILHQQPQNYEYDIWNSLAVENGFNISTSCSGPLGSPGSDCTPSGGVVALPNIEKFSISHHNIGTRLAHPDIPELSDLNHLSDLSCLLNSSSSGSGGASSPDSVLDADLTHGGGRGVTVMSPDSQMCVSSTARDLYSEYPQQQANRKESDSFNPNCTLKPRTYSASFLLSPNSVHYTPTVPSSTRYPGEYGFEVSVEKQPKETKSASWTAHMVSGMLQKLYVRLGIPCPFIFKTATPPPLGAVIRALPVYMKPEHVQDIVKRCPNHSAKRSPTESPHSAQHLIRLDHQGTQYLQDPCTGRLSVLIPHELPQAGAEWVTYLFQFMCFSSCVGGLNRRPVHIIFTLEFDGQVLGRQSVEVRICACPGRDRMADERDRQQQLNPSAGVPGGEKRSALKRMSSVGEGGGMSQQITDELGVINASTKKRKMSPTLGQSEGLKLGGAEDDGVYTLRVRGRENYELLLRLRDVMELKSLIPQHIIDQYRTKAYCGDDFINTQEDNKMFVIQQQILLQQQQQQQQQQQLQLHRQSPTYDIKLPRKSSPPLTPCCSIDSPLSSYTYRDTMGSSSLADGQSILGGMGRNQGILGFEAGDTFYQ